MPVKFLPATDALLTVEVVLSKVKALCTVVYILETEDNSSPLTMVAYG